MFSVRGNKPVSGFGDIKLKIDRRLAELSGDVEPWVFHDIRQSLATGMADLNVAPHVLDRVLNHVSGSISGVAAIYNREQYRDERKAALNSWGDYVARLVGENVVPLRAS